MEFMYWKVKGYKGIHLTKEKLDSKKYSFDEIKKIDSNIIKQIENNLENGGIVLALEKKKIIKAIYFFKLRTDDEEKVLIFDKKVVLEEANKCIKEFENDINTVLDTILVNRHDIDRAIWREKEVSKKEKFKSFITAIKNWTWFGIIICCMMSLALIILGTSYSLGASNSSIEEIKEDELIISYVSDINNYDYSEAIESVDYTKKEGFIVFEIVMPTIFTLVGYILLIISLKRILDLMKNVTDNKSLFTNDKNQLLTKIIFCAIPALFILIGNLILWIGIITILEIIQYMFNYCVQLTNEKNNKIINV